MMTSVAELMDVFRLQRHAGPAGGSREHKHRSRTVQLKQILQLIAAVTVRRTCLHSQSGDLCCIYPLWIRDLE